MGGGTTKSTQKKHLQEALNLSFGKLKKPMSTLPPTLEIVFSNLDLEGVIPGHDGPMVIFTVMVNDEITKMFIDQGSSADIIF